MRFAMAGPIVFQERTDPALAASAARFGDTLAAPRRQHLTDRLAVYTKHPEASRVLIPST